MTDVFSAAVRRRNNEGMTFGRMEALTWDVGGKEGSRSSAWWNNMARYDMETPPAPKYFPGIAAVLQVSQRRVSEMVAEQWYHVKPDDRLPRGLEPLVSAAETLDPEDVERLTDMARHLLEIRRELRGLQGGEGDYDPD
ncbi:hypothetical protein [Streptomyces sp. NPDC048191]|uniref:hypothetical protein n=1 Tax=Streptomyces sp. NPDC048191 TaxID=3155484 RepID=UPI0033FFA470